MALGQTVQPLDRPQDQVAVGRVRDGLGLHGGVNGNPFQLALAHRFGLHGNGNGLGQQRLQIIRPDPLAPAGHRGAVCRQAMLEMHLAAEGLKVRVLQPRRAGFLV